MVPVSSAILWRAVLAQALTVVTLFAILLALPLPTALVREQGTWIGPLSWFVCALVSGRVLRLAAGRIVGAAVVSGGAAVGASVVIGHSGGMVAGSFSSNWSAPCGSDARVRLHPPATSRRRKTTSPAARAGTA